MWNERLPPKQTRQNFRSSINQPSTESGYTHQSASSVSRSGKPLAVNNYDVAYCPGSRQGLNEGNHQSFDNSQRNLNFQTRVSRFAQNRATYQTPTGSLRHSWVRATLNNPFSNNGNIGARYAHPYGNFRGLVRNVFRQRFLSPRAISSSNQSQYRSMVKKDSQGEHQSQIAPITTDKQIVNSKNDTKHTVKAPHSNKPDQVTSSGSSGLGLRPSHMHRNACGGMPSLPIVCLKAKCGPFTDKWLKVGFCNSLHAEGNQKDFQGWFFMSVARPVISFMQNSEMQDFPHYHISNPLFIGPDQLGRKMKPVPIPNEVSSICDSFSFSVLSYNILSDELLWQNAQLYRDCPSWTLQWDYRKDNLMKEIESYNADILCFQEVYQDHFHSWLLPKLVKKGYLGVFKKRTGNKSDGCATFFRENRFICRARRVVEYKIPGHSLMDRDNIGIIVALEPKEQDKTLNKPTIFVANTHLLFNMNRGDIKLLQLAKLLSEIDEMSKVASDMPQKATAEDQYNPVILCGDFNSTPFSPLYDFMIKSKLRYEGLSRIHLSGQNRPTKFASDHTSLRRDLIPKELNISYLCQKVVANPSQNNTRSTNHEAIDSRNDDCFVVGEVIDGKAVVMEEPGVLKHLLRLQSAYMHDPRDHKNEVTSSQGIVDYIMFSQGMKRIVTENMSNEGEVFVKVPRKQLYLTGILTLLSQSDLTSMSSIPNPIVSSDHLALLATFRLLE